MAGWSSNQATFFPVVPAITAGIIAMVIKSFDRAGVGRGALGGHELRGEDSFLGQPAVGNDSVSGSLIDKALTTLAPSWESELDHTDQNENDHDNHDNAHDSNAAVSRAHAGPLLGIQGRAPCSCQGA